MNERLEIAVCDDDVRTSGLMKGAIESIFTERQKSVFVEEFHSAKELRRRFREKPFDLIFLDIDMPEEDGIQLGGALREENLNVDFIFVSSHEERVFETFKIQPFGFVRKNKFFKDISCVIEDYIAKALPYETGKFLYSKTREGSVRVSIADIVYIEGDRECQILHLSKGTTISVLCLMVTLEEDLKGYGFIRTHKGYLVHYRYIQRFTKCDIILTNGELVPVSRRRMSEVKRRYMELIQGSGTIIL